MKKLYAVLIVFALFILVIPQHVLASPRQEVLGDSSNNELFPAVSAGTGFLLPDSPFYFLDKIFQGLKLTASINPQAKAKIEIQIIGERMAELRVMHAKGNRDGINVVLSEIEKEARNAAQYVKDAAAEGGDVTVLAKQINDYFRDYRTVLTTASQNSNEELSLKLDSTNQSLLVSKVNVEDFLNPADQDDAIQSDLEDEVERVVLGAEAKANATEKKIDNLEKRASKAAELQAKKDAIKEFLDTKKAENKNLLEQKKKLQEQRKKLLEERKKKLQAAREAFKKAKEAAKHFKDAKKAEQELKKTTIPVLNVVDATPTPMPQVLE